jgi:hypothetical protein
MVDANHLSRPLTIFNHQPLTMYSIRKGSGVAGSVTGNEFTDRLHIIKRLKRPA